MAPENKGYSENLNPLITCWQLYMNLVFHTTVSTKSNSFRYTWFNKHSNLNHSDNSLYDVRDLTNKMTNKRTYNITKWF